MGNLYGYIRVSTRDQNEDGTSSVFTLNPALQKQLDALAAEHPEVCQRKARGEAGGVTYQVRGAALAIQPVRVS